MVKIADSIRSFFVGKGSLSDFGDRYPALDRNNMSSVDGLYVIGNIAGTPDIRAALNAGSDVGRLLERSDGVADLRGEGEADYDVVIVGGGPAGIACAAALKGSGKSFVVLERKKILSTIRAFKPDLILYDAVTGERGNRSVFGYADTTADELLADWKGKLAELDLPIRENVSVVDVARMGGFFRLDVKDEKAITARRVVLALGKLIQLEKVRAGEEKLDCREIEHSVAKMDEPETSTVCEVIGRSGIRMERQLDAKGLSFLGAWIAGIVGMYLWLYYGNYNDKGHHLIPFTNVGLPGWMLYSSAYTLVIWVFGIKAILRWKSPLQTKKFSFLIFSQTVLFWGLPIFAFSKISGFSSPGSGYELAYAWPLAVKPENTQFWFNSGGWAFYMFMWNMALSFILIPFITIKHGKKYCSWVCGCGGLAETLGDQWRHYSPKGDANKAREKQGYWITGLAVVASVVVAANLLFPGNKVMGDSSSFLTRIYGGIVDVWLIGIIPVALYPFLGGKLWCRFWCPTAVYMQLFSKMWATLRATKNKVQHTTFAIFARKERCIVCNMCTRYCEVGIDVRKFAIKGTTFDNTNSSCIGCGICISVCPTETLDFDPTFGGQVGAGKEQPAEPATVDA